MSLKKFDQGRLHLDCLGCGNPLELDAGEAEFVGLAADPENKMHWTLVFRSCPHCKEKGKQYDHHIVAGFLDDGSPDHPHYSIIQDLVDFHGGKPKVFH